MRKVLIVHNEYQIPGGEDTVVNNECKMLEENGHKVFLYIRNNNEIKDMTNLKKMLLPLVLIFNVKVYRDIKKIIRNESIEIVHVHNTLNLISPAVYYASVMTKVPVVQTIHNFRLLCPGAMLYRNSSICEDCISKGLLCAVKYKCYRGSRLQTLACVISTKIHRITGIYKKINYICLTDFNKKKLLKQKQICEKQIYVKPNFTNSVDYIIPYEERNNQFVFAGRIDRLKGVDLLLKAWKKMGNGMLQLIICGNGPMDEWCKNYIKENHISNIALYGHISHKDVMNVIGKSKALLLPTQWYEGFPMNIVEAYSVGTPVIGSDIGNVGNIIIEGKTGWKFQHDSVDALIRAVKCEKNIVENVVAEYKKQYTTSINYRQLMDIYESVIKNETDKL